MTTQTEPKYTRRFDNLELGKFNLANYYIGEYMHSRSANVVGLGAGRMFMGRGIELVIDVDGTPVFRIDKINRTIEITTTVERDFAEATSLNVKAGRWDVNGALY